MVIIFDWPVRRVGWQAILGSHRSEAIVLTPAEATLGGDPERSVIAEVKIAATSRAEAFDGCVGCADLTASQIGDSPSVKSNPQPTQAMISSQNTGIILMS